METDFDFVFPRTESPEPYNEPEDHSRLTFTSASAGATAKTTGSIIRNGTAGRLKTNPQSQNVAEPLPATTPLPALTTSHSTSATIQATGSIARTGTGGRHATEPPSQGVSGSAPTVAATRYSRQWHPKLTAYRLIVILTTLGFGISKAVLSYQGLSIIPITLEWFMGTGVFLLFFALDTYQASSQSTILSWFFEVDLSYVTWRRVCRLFGIVNPPFYSTEEQTRRQSLVTSKYPPIRGYDLLITFSTAVVGMSKSILAYQGHDIAMTTVDWVGAVVVGIALYWLGLYESNPNGLMPYLFTTDYSDDIKTNLISPYAPFRFLPQLAIMALACWWSYKCVGWTTLLANVFDGVEEPSDELLTKIMNHFVFPCFTAAYVSMGMVSIGAGVLVVLAIVFSGFRLGRLTESGSLLWRYTGFFFRICGFYGFFIMTLTPCLVIMVPILQMLLSSAKEEPVLYVSIVLLIGGTVILSMMFWWLFRGLLQELGVIARVLGRPILRLYAEYLARRRRTGSMGV